MIGIQSPRVLLEPFRRAHAEALERGPHQLADLLGIRVPSDWPAFPEAYSPAAIGRSDHGVVVRPGETHWGTYLFIQVDGSSVVGSGGFKGRPVDGVVEVGYEVAPGFVNQGFATEAVNAMVAEAFAHEEVERVRAHTLPYRNASTRVLEKGGFAFVGAVADADGESIWRWEVSRLRS